jgi:hypothetical protein
MIHQLVNDNLWIMIKCTVVRRGETKVLHKVKVLEEHYCSLKNEGKGKGGAQQLSIKGIEVRKYHGMHRSYSARSARVDDPCIIRKV